MTTVHDSRARRAAARIHAGREPAALAHGSARQGDLILHRTGDATADPEHRPTPKAGITLAAGSHGEHRLIATSALVTWHGHGEGATISIPDGGLIVHTDRPDGRHAPIRVRAGTWAARGQRELGPDQIVRQVAD